MSINRVFLIVLDSFGIGSLPDAADYGDEGANTLKTLRSSPRFSAPVLERLGLFNIEGVGGGVAAPLGAYARLAEKSRGKDTIIGHLEICGLISERDLPTYKNGFPEEIIDEFKRITGRGVLCNRPYSGTEVIRDFGDAHVKSGDLIVYTSADSVFQVAAHEDTVPLKTLYYYCSEARKLLKGENGVGRVIARPFTGGPGNYIRTPNRRDYSLIPPGKTLLDFVKGAGLEVIAIGKISDIFAGQGIGESIKTAGNAAGMKAVSEVASRNFSGLCFTNLVDFDMLYGHRNDIDGYAAAISEFDGWLGSFIPSLKDGDALFITADHGCDPGYPTSDHTREYIPLIVYGKSIKSLNLGTRGSFSDIGSTVADMLRISADIDGVSFFNEIGKTDVRS